jgi:hypothetical protein
MTLDCNFEEDNNIKIIAQNSTGMLSDQYDNDEREGESPSIRWLMSLMDSNLCMKMR